ncbi:MAG: GNAT family N-acetyltransferase [Elusimicrobiota bacterium]|jgi:ribosomal protein S18 acetylase RimI-like enzyme
MKNEKPSFEIRLCRGDAERRACAEIMATTDPWLTLGRDLAFCYAALEGSGKELYVAVDDGKVLGLIALNMKGSLVGYIQSVAVRADARGRGVGRALVAYAEERVFSEVPNVFLLVSSFNAGARKLYEELGYSFVGELKDFVVAGHSENLMRKTLGPLRGYKPSPRPPS